MKKKNCLILSKVPEFLFASKSQINSTIKIFMCLIFVTNTLFGQIKEEMQPWQDSDHRSELLSKRTRNSKHFINTNGSNSAFVSPSSIHYIDENNNWKEINTIITGNNSTTYPYSSVENSIKTYFPMNPFNSYILMKSEEGSFKEKIASITFLDSNKNIIKTLALSSGIGVTVDENKIMYSGFYDNLSLCYTLNNDSRKFDLIVESKNFLNAVPPGAKFINVQEEFIMEDKNTQIRSHNDAITVVQKGIEVLGFEQPLAFDNSTLTDNSFKGNMSYTKKGNTVYLNTSFNLSWIRSTERKFPIHLDPTTNYYPQTTTYWTGYQTSSSSKTSGQIRVAGANNQGWGKFDLTSLPVGCTVTQATYYGYHYSTTSTTKICNIRSMGSVDPVSSTASAIFTQITTGALYNGNYTYGGSTYSWNPGSLSGTALSDIASAAGSWIGLGFSYLSGSTTFMYHYGVNGSSSQICYLEVVYYTVPCSSIPGANSVVTPTNGICPGTSANLSLANTYSVGGISYQWQSSTVSAVGPFNSVTGATNSAMSTPTLNVQTWYNTVITCTNVSGSVTASTGLVMVQATTIDSMPYFESFEGIDAENKLPNCSWAGSNMGFTTLTYTASNSLGRTPRTGNNFASFYYTPVGSKYFYTNGLYLNAGVTYSASLFFKTDYYGYNNWTDLSILIGANQSTLGLSTIVSTNGPAVSNIYKSLSDTFTVASSGIYYIAIRATSTSGSGQYLSWDDLEVTAPCSLNSPTVNLSANSSSICAGEVVNLSASGADYFLWNTGSTSNAVNVTPLTTTIYEVIGTNTLTGCSDTLSTQIFVKPSPQVLIYADSPTVCAGNNVNLYAFGAISYTWSNGGSGPVAFVSPTVTSSYLVVGTNTIGCSNTASVLINVDPLPNISVSSSFPNGMCVGEMLTLTATGGLSYLWNTSTDPLIYAGANITIIPSITTTYTVTGTDVNGCANKSTLVQNVSECTSMNELEAPVADLFIYPNPTKGKLVVQFNSSLKKQITLVDITGRMIIRNSIYDQKLELDLGLLADGVYYLMVETNKKTETIKVIKQ